MMISQRVEFGILYINDDNLILMSIIIIKLTIVTFIAIIMGRIEVSFLVINRTLLDST